MKNLSYIERKLLINNHMKEGYTFHEACQMIKADMESVRTINTKLRKTKRDNKNKSKQKDLFKIKFKEMVNGDD